MADNIYLLETRLSPAQQTALGAVRSVAREQGLTVFLVGGAVRDLISGSPVRDLDVVVQGDARTLRKQLEAAGAVFSGESAPLQSLYVRFPSGVRVEVGSTLSVSFSKPGKPIFQPATILEDLRRRDFTANAMALSLNEGSYGLLMDPLNGVADIENRELRLVSNYGFIEDPARLIRAARFMARLGWQMDERTRTRYETAKEENSIAVLQAADRGYEAEELFHEEEPLRVMRRLEEEGWLKHLSPALGVAKVNAPELARLREAQMQLEAQGIRADAAAANFPLLTSKVPAAEVEALKKSFPRITFISEINTLESAAKELGSQLVSKAMSAPSEAYKLIRRSDPVTVVWTLYSSKSAVLQAKLKSFINEWPQAQSRIPILLMTEMRITPELPAYAELQETIFYALMDGRLTTPEEMKSFLEPYSPPAPPPPISLRRPRAPRKEAKAAKSRKKAAPDADGQDAADTPTISSEASSPAAAQTEASVVAAPSAAQETKVQKPPTAVPPPPSQKIDSSDKVAEKKPKSLKKVEAASEPARTSAVKAPAKKTGEPAPLAPAKQTKPVAKPSTPVAARKGTPAPASKATKTPSRAVQAKGSPAKKVAVVSAGKKSASAKKAVQAKKSVSVKGPAASKTSSKKTITKLSTSKKGVPAGKTQPAKKAAVKKSSAKRR